MLHFMYLQPLSTCEGFEMRRFPNGPQQFEQPEVVVLIQCHFKSGSTVMLYNNCWDTGLMGKNSAPFAGDAGKLNLPAMTQCPQIKILKFSYNICHFSNAGWMFSWCCREEGFGMTSLGEAAIFMPLANKHILIHTFTVCQELILTPTKSLTNPNPPQKVNAVVELYYAFFNNKYHWSQWLSTSCHTKSCV